jgi:hypothetical protein
MMDSGVISHGRCFFGKKGIHFLQKWRKMRGLPAAGSQNSGGVDRKQD